jgi:hypothetical protein
MRRRHHTVNRWDDQSGNEMAMLDSVFWSGGAGVLAMQESLRTRGMVA